MENISIRFVYDKNKKASSSNPVTLSIEVRQTGTNRSVYIGTGIKLYPDQFSDKNGFTCRNHDKANQVTLKAREVFNKVEAFALSDECTSLGEVKNYLVAKTYNKNVLEFMRRELRERRASISVIEHHNILFGQIESYGKIRLFSDLTFANIDGFDKHLRKTIKSQPVLYKRHNAFKTYIRKAVRLGLCKYNPYDDFKVVKGSHKEPTFLIEEEVQKIIDFNSPVEKLMDARDLFIFQCFTGLAYIDLMAFDSSWVYEVDGYKVFRDARNKSEVGFFSLFLPQAEKILKKHKGSLPRLSNQKYNDYLKLVQAGCGIRKKLTTHVARHTFATYLLNKDVPIESVSKAIGHKSIRQTQHYAKLLNKKVINDKKGLLE